jgi:hypothetical protein
MNFERTIFGALLASGLAVAAASTDAEAAVCNGNMAAWKSNSTIIGCFNNNRASSIGSGQVGLLDVSLSVNLIQGTHAWAFGYKTNGTVLPNCFAFDQTVGGAPGQSPPASCGPLATRQQATVFFPDPI